jgi:glutamate dehydrogenase
LKQSDLHLRIETKQDNGASQITFITSQNYKGLLAQQASLVASKKDEHMSRVKVFTSLDGELTLSVFYFEKDKTAFVGSTEADAGSAFSFAEEVKAGKHKTDAVIQNLNPSYFDKANINEYLQHITQVHTKASDPRRFFIQRSLFEKVRGTENTAVFMEDYSGHEKTNVGTSWSWITVAAANVLPEVLIRLCAQTVTRSGLDVARANLDLLDDPVNKVGNAAGNGFVSNTGTVTILRMLVSPNINAHKTAFIPQANFAQTLQRELERVKWLDDTTTELVDKHPFLGIDKSEVITAVCSLLHGPLSKLNPTAYGSIPTILKILDNQHVIPRADEIATLFLDKFRAVSAGADGKFVGLSEGDFNARAAKIEEHVNVLQNEHSRVLLQRMLNVVKNTLRTNFYNKERFSLALRIDPRIMVAPDTPAHKIPYGVFFCHGRNYNGFHCRFRDIARGGLRIVTPKTADQYIHSSAQQFDEAYGLSYAQQLKNKDIPEGGSKAVVLVNSPSISPIHTEFAMRKAVKAFTDSLLDLIVAPSVSQLVDYLKKDELIYLGPDEQVIPWDIDWIIGRAGERKYPIPSAFMSSKAAAGINHKVYGVTSEGVVVYLDTAMRHVLKKDPYKQPFSVKITGGPDGDVAGNLLKILFREYGTNCKVVGISDGFGVAEDPNGLDWPEMLRLFKEGLPITHYKGKLSQGSNPGVLMTRDTDEGLQRANTMFLRVKADVFVPAGGRPNTMNASNWEQFLDSDKKPTSLLIVEGANIFNTPEARANLFKAGVAIVKDSSANKCGVITSSCEVQASMVLSKDEFISIKKELVDDVIVKLKHVAKQEADLMFRAYSNFPGDLPHFSERISDSINRCTDAIADSLTNVNPGDALFEELRPLIKGKIV